MSVTIQPPVRTGRFTWKLTYASDLGGTPTFTIRVDGVAVYVGTATTYELITSAGASPIIEITDDDAAPTITAHPAYMLLQWYVAPATELTTIREYRVEQFDGADWDTVATLPAEEKGIYSYRTAALADVTSHQFRVVPVGLNGNDGTVRTFTALIVRYPDAPSVTMTYDGSGPKTITITAA